MITFYIILVLIRSVVLKIYYLVSKELIKQLQRQGKLAINAFFYRQRGSRGGARRRRCRAFAIYACYVCINLLVLIEWTLMAQENCFDSFDVR